MHQNLLFVGGKRLAVRNYGLCGHAYGLRPRDQAWILSSGIKTGVFDFYVFLRRLVEIIIILHIIY